MRSSYTFINICFFYTITFTIGFSFKINLDLVNEQKITNKIFKGKRTANTIENIVYLRTFRPSTAAIINV